MRTPPLALLLTLALAPVLANAQAVAPGQVPSPDPSLAVGVGPDVTPGYYPTWQSSQPPMGGGSALQDNGRYTRSGFPTGQTTVQYRPDVEPGTAPMISPYLQRNDTTVGGQPTFGHMADLYLSPFVPQTAVFYSPDGRTSTRISWDAGLYLRQDIDLEHSQIQAGPLFIDFTEIEADALYSDISGPFAKQLPSDGFIAAIGLYFNIDLRLSPRTFFTVTGAIFYVPTDNRFGLFVTGANSPYADFEHSFEVGRWDVTIFDTIDVITPLSYVLQSVGSSAYDRSGLYTLGLISGGFDHPFDSDLFFIRNTVGIKGSTFLGPDLRLTTGFEHYDEWSGSGSKYYNNLDHYYAGLFYEPQDLWLMPWATYDAYMYDSFSGSLQQFYLGATMPFSPTLNGYARVGYAWQSGVLGRGFNDGTLVWDVGLAQQISPTWSQSIAVGNSYRISPLLQTTSGMYATYQISFTPPESRFFAAAAVTWAKIDPGRYDSWLTTVTAGYTIDDRTTARALVLYAPSTWDSNSSAGDTNIWLYRAELDRIITSTLTLRLIYQHTDYGTTIVDGAYQDNLIMLSLTKTL